MAQIIVRDRGADEHLTHTEILALTYLATGMTAAAAARHLAISERTLRRRIRLACDRLDVNTPIEAVVWAAKRGLV